MPRKYKFGDFRIDTVEETLYRNGQKLNINRRTFQVLRLLVTRAGEIVSKQDFFDTVWADTFVEDNSLTVAITGLRKVLGDDAKNATFIENLPRKGYRFIGKVEIADEEKENTEPLQAQVHIDKGSFATALYGRKILAGLSAIVIISLLAVFGSRYARSGGTSNRSEAIDSIAVLPFENQDADTEYLSDGLTESIISQLATLPNLRVINRNSVFQYKNKSIDLQETGRNLNVRAILTGRITEDGEDLVVSVEMTDVTKNELVWARQFKRRMSDSFGLQQELSRDISESLRPQLTSEQRRQVAKDQTVSPEAFHLYLKGRYEWNKRSNESLLKAAELYKKAIDIDPTYALAYVGLANCYLSINFPYPVTADERVAMVKATAARALEIDPRLGEAYAALALNSQFNEWDWKTAEDQFKVAIELNPNYGTAHHWYAEFLALDGRFDESFAEFQVAMQLDPLSLAIGTDLGMAYYYARQPDRAIDQLQKIKKIDPAYFRTPIFLTLVYEQEEMFDAVLDEMGQAIALQGEDAKPWEMRRAELADAVKRAGADGYWSNILRTEENKPNPNALTLLKCHLRLGEKEKAFNIIEKFIAIRSPILIAIKVSPDFDGIRSDPRFPDVVERIHGR